MNKADVLSLAPTALPAPDPAQPDETQPDEAPPDEAATSRSAPAPRHTRGEAARRSAGRCAPGLVLVAVMVALAYATSLALPALSPLMLAVVLGALLTNLGLVPERARPGLHFAAKRLLRLGVVLLGFQLALGQVLRLGGPGLLVVVSVVTLTFFGTQWIGRRLGLSPSLSLLVATGFSICGASAIAAMEGVADAEEEEVAFSIALVTLCGSLCIFLLPPLRGILGLDPAQFGSWVGASVHDVGQVVATASTAGALALQTAVLVKLTRVVLLAPIVTGVSLARRRRALVADAASPVAAGPAAAPAAAGREAPAATKRPPILPLFVAGFLAAVAVRSTGIVPAAWLHSIKVGQDLMLAAALVGLGTGVHIAKLRKVGGRPLVLALISWVLIASVAYVGVLVVGA